MQVSSVQFSCSVVSDSFRPHEWQASLSITNSKSSLRLMSIESVMQSSHLILSRPLLLLPPIPPSIRVFSNESTLRMRWPKYWSFSFSIIHSKEIPGLISFRMGWLDLLAVQGTLKVFSNTTVQKHQFFEVRGDSREELPHARGQGQRLGGPTPCLRPGTAAWRTNPTFKDQWLCVGPRGAIPH